MARVVVTSNGKKGGVVGGKSHAEGGVKTIVKDTGQPLELESGEVVINKHASKKHWKTLSKINQSAGNGVPIKKPSGAEDNDEDIDAEQEELKNGGVIKFKQGKLPKPAIISFAQSVKSKYPKVWALGGNIYGNQAFLNLQAVRKRGYWKDSEEWMYKKWQAFIARHKGNVNTAGVVAMLKWAGVVEKGWPYMKGVIMDEARRLHPDKFRNKKMANGGVVAPYAFVRAYGVDGKPVFAVFEGNPSHEDVYNYFLKRINLKIRDSEIESYSSNFDREVFTNYLQLICQQKYGLGLKDPSSLIFSYDKHNKSVFEFEATLENGQAVSVKMIAGVILVELKGEKAERGANIKKELKKGIEVEKEHSETAKKLYNQEITPADAPESIAKEHLKESNRYYTELGLMEKKFARGGNLEPHKEVSASVKVALSDVLAQEKYSIIKPMKAQMLYNKFKDYKEFEVDKESGLPVLRESLSDMEIAMFKDLEEKHGYISDLDYVGAFFETRGQTKLEQKGQDFIDAINTRLQTRRAVKAGTDLFPNESAIPELVSSEIELIEEDELDVQSEHETQESQSFLETYRPVFWHLTKDEFCQYAEKYSGKDKRIEGIKSPEDCHKFYVYKVIKPMLHETAERNLFLLAVETGQLPYDKAEMILKSAVAWDENNKYVKQLIENDRLRNGPAQFWLVPKEIYLESDYFKNNFTKSGANKWYKANIFNRFLLSESAVVDLVKRGLVKYRHVLARMKEAGYTDEELEKHAYVLNKIKSLSDKTQVKMKMKSLAAIILNEKEQLFFSAGDIVEFKGLEHKVTDKKGLSQSPNESWIEPTFGNSGGQWAKHSELKRVKKASDVEIGQAKWTIKDIEQRLKDNPNDPFKDALLEKLSLAKKAIGENQPSSADLSKLPSNEGEFVSKLITATKNGVEYNKSTLEKFAKTFGITEQNLVKELAELSICLIAKEYAQEKNLSQKERYDKIVGLYKKQVNLSHRNSQSILFQQYSTPAPISYAAGVFCKLDQPGSFFEPSAGNGLLSLAANPGNFVVNEIDDVRNRNLSIQGYKQVLKQDATEPFTGLEKSFDAVITNPPFGSTEAVKYGNTDIKSLEQLMALRGLDCMKDTGRAAIIIGGHQQFDSEGRIQAGKNRTFFVYLYKHYNVLDVINVDGHALYSRQGTGFNVRLILIDGRKENPSGFPPLVESPLPVTSINSYTPVKDFETLWKRIMKSI